MGRPLHSGSIPHVERAVELATGRCPWRRRLFRTPILGVEMLSSALKHGVVESDIRHALAYALVGKVLAEDPVRTLYLGPDSAGNLLELVLLDRPQGPA